MKLLPVFIGAITLIFLLDYLPLARGYPSVYFVPPTDPDNAVVNRDWSYVNVSINEIQAPYNGGSAGGPTDITLVATSIVCDSESLLPNWGGHGIPEITPNTASDYVSSHPGCRLAPGWSFQWGPQVNPSPPLDPPNPGNEVDVAPLPWKTFGSSNSSGVAITAISQSEYSGITGIWLREVFQNGYLAFSNHKFNPDDGGSDVSAEFYCDKDVWNYDNYDYIDDSGAALQPGKTYYCIAFNVGSASITGLIDWNRSLVGWLRFEDVVDSPPLRSSGSPYGIFRSDVDQAVLSLTTDEQAACRYSDSTGVPYSSMTEYFSTADGLFHTKTVTGLEPGKTYNYYVKCKDAANNENTDDYVIAFSVGQATSNMLLNADFEGGFTEGKANNWNLGNDFTVVYALSQDAGYTGSAQEISISSPGSWGLFLNQNPSFTLNGYYWWSFWYKSTGGNLYAQIIKDTGEPENTVYSELLPPTDGVWTYKSIYFQWTNTNANQLRFYSNSVGSYWIDNIILKSSAQPQDMDDCVFAPEANRAIVMFNGGMVSSGTETDARISVPASLPAGRYRVSLMSYDGYVNRINVFQPNESYFAKFYSGANLVAQSDSLSDLIDYVAYTNRAEIVNDDLYLGESVDSVVAYHSVYPDASSPNSNQPICAAFDRLDPPGAGGGSGECSSLFTDSSTWGNNGTCSGSSCPACVSGKFGKALEFDGADDYVNLGNPSSLQITGAMTVTAWIYLDDLSETAHRIVSKLGLAGNRGWELLLDDDPRNNLMFRISSDGTNLFDVKQATEYALAGQWAFVAGTYEPGVSTRLYLNGTLINSNTASVPSSQFDPSNNVNIGRGPAGYSPFDGVIDEVQIYSRALSPEEINASYNAGLYRLQRNFTGLADGVYTYRAYAQDAAGNVNSTETRTLTVQTLFPPPPPVPSDYNLAMFSAETIHIQMGESMLVKAYVKNPDPQFANIAVWLGGDYPAALAKFSIEDGLYLTSDQRNLTVGLNPNQERALSLVVSSTVPKSGSINYYIINITANTTADSNLKDYQSMKVFIDCAPSFPALELWGILLVLAVSGLAYWKIKK